MNEMNVVIRRVEYPDLPNYYGCEMAAPRMVDGAIEIYEGRGTSHRWGQSRLTSSIVFQSDDLVVIDVVGWHKFTVSPVGGRYYFVIGKQGDWQRTTGNHRMAQQWRLGTTGVQTNVAATI